MQMCHKISFLYLCPVKLLKTIFSFALILVSLVCSKAFANNIFISNAYTITSASPNLSVDRNKKASLKKAVSIESFFLKSSAQSSVTPRIEERCFTDALFLSFFSYKRVTKTCGNLNDNLQLQFVPFALKLIYPHHHFW